MGRCIIFLDSERKNGVGLIPSVREYRDFFGITEERLAKHKKEIVIMHPGPMNRGVEIDSAVADGDQAIILDQVLNGVAVRMSILYSLLGPEEEVKMKANKVLSGKWAFVNGKIYDPFKKVYINGSIVIEDGIIISVGDVDVSDAETIDCNGRNNYSGIY